MIWKGVIIIYNIVTRASKKCPSYKMGSIFFFLRSVTKRSCAAAADFPKDSSLGISMDILKTNTVKKHTDPHTVRGRPALKDVERFRNRTVRELDLLWARLSGFTIIPFRSYQLTVSKFIFQPLVFQTCGRTQCSSSTTAMRFACFRW